MTGYKEKAVTTDEKLNTFEEITGYNNFYEFGTGKSDPKRYGGTLKTSPWTVKIDGLCNKPADYHLEDLIKPIQLEERIYRLRCVEAWSMVIPWIGVPLSEDHRAGGADVEGDLRSVHDAAAADRRCPGRAHPASSGRTLRGCGWTRPCIR